MQPIPSSELIINPDGTIYHLNIRPDQIADTIITVGDPDRVEHVSKHFDRVDTIVAKREFVTHTGELNGQRISVISTGIGTDNIDIVFNELDALVNIDFETRLPKGEKKSLKIIRIGTSGCLQKEVPVDSFLISSFGLGMDGLLNYYHYENDAEEKELLEAVLTQPNLAGRFPIAPYLIRGSASLAEKIGFDFLKGITLTCTGFYGPQGRELMLKSKVNELIPRFADFQHGAHRITNFEMETAGIYGMSKLLGHEALSCNALLANRITGEFSQQPKEIVKKLIETVLERLV